MKTKIKKEKLALVAEKSDAVKVVDKFMYRREMKVLRVLNQILPRTYISLPKISVGNLIEPTGVSKLEYNKYKEFIVDFVVFEEASMKPLAIVDVYDNSYEDELLKDKNSGLVNLLTGLKLPVIDFAVKDDVDTGLLKDKLYKALKLEIASVKPETKSINN